MGGRRQGGARSEARTRTTLTLIFARREDTRRGRIMQAYGNALPEFAPPLPARVRTLNNILLRLGEEEEAPSGDGRQRAGESLRGRCFVGDGIRIRKSRERTRNHHAPTSVLQLRPMLSEQQTHYLDAEVPSRDHARQWVSRSWPHGTLPSLQRDPSLLRPARRLGSCARVSVTSRVQIYNKAGTANATAGVFMLSYDVSISGRHPVTPVTGPDHSRCPIAGLGWPPGGVVDLDFRVRA